MNPEIKREWVAALRSGDYKEGRQYLRSNSGYCCLGVLCQIASDKGIIEEPRLVADSSLPAHYLYDMQGYFPSAMVKVWSGLDHGSFITDEDGFLDKALEYLPENNDNGMSFNDIADIIERNL